MEFINISCITNVRILPKSRTDYFEWRDGKDGLFHSRKEGFYTFGDDGPYTYDEVAADGRFMVSRERVYWRPRLILYFTSGRQQEMFFDSIEDAADFFEKNIKPLTSWITK